MLKEIGSNFWLDTTQIEMYCNKGINLADFGIRGKETLLLSTGRAAIRYAISDIKKERSKEKLVAVIPAYTCDTVLQPFLDENVVVRVYDINMNLGIDTKKFKSLIESENPDIVLIHRYFGFDSADNINDIIQLYRKKGGILIEDRTQCLFSHFDSLDADYIIGSFRKWVALPDGGFCVKTNKKFEFREKLLQEDSKLVACKLKAFQQKYDYMEYDKGNKSTFLETYRSAEQILDEQKKFYSMSNISKNIFSSIDISEIIEKRRKNYTYLFNNLNNANLSFVTGVLVDDISPLYMVIKSNRRNDLQVELRNNNIYAPVVWPKPKMIPQISEVVEIIYKEVLCLPVDQRYDIDDMERMIEIINNFT